MPSTSKITSKGQVTIPKGVRTALGVAEGDRIEFVFTADGSVILRPLARSARELFGLLRRDGQAPVSIEEMDRAVAEHLADDDERIRRQRPR